MQVKRFEARDIQEAIKQVKEAMGPEAIILSTKTLKTSPYRSGYQPASVEVVAAIDRPDDSPGKASATTPFSFVPQVTKGEDGGRREEEVIIQRILATGLSPKFVNRLSEGIQTLRRESRGWSPLEVYRGLLRWKLMESVEVVSPSFEGRRIWSFIGPTGVGKTTTLVKLAAHFQLRMSKKVTLITIDTYRIGAVEQLKIYAQILRVPLEIAHCPEELKQITTRNIDRDLLLIDTTGRSPNHLDHVKTLKDFLTVDPQIENHLLLSATTKGRDLYQIFQRFSLIPIRSVIFTKIDETEEYGSMMNQLMGFGKPLSYLTNGQRVPEDIEAATKAGVVNLLMNQIQWN
jgi:flagellar biosynthesis protein FlhF